jgi:hypothetical protein
VTAHQTATTTQFQDVAIHNAILLEAVEPTTVRNTIPTLDHVVHPEFSAASARVVRHAVTATQARTAVAFQANTSHVAEPALISVVVVADPRAAVLLCPAVTPFLIRT